MPTPGRARRIGPFPVVDLTIALLFALATFAICYRAANWSSALYTRPQAADVWFDADVYRVFTTATDRDAFNDRGSLHPLWPFLSYPSVQGLMKLGRWDASALRIFHSGLAAAWAAGFFLLLRRFGLRRPDATLFTVTAATTSSAFFWLPATETFTVGSLSLFPALALAAGRSPASPAHQFFAGIAAASITVTNWMVSLFAAVADARPRRAITFSLAGFAAVVLLSRLQSLLYPAGLTLAHGFDLNAPWIFALHSGGPFAILRAFFFGGVVAPDIRFLPNWQDPAWPLLSFQFGGLFTGTVWTWLATPAWAALLLIGAAALWRRETLPRVKIVLTLTILYQLLMHLIYGGETFLYSMHWVPLLIMAAALGTLTRRRPLVLALAALLSVANIANNAAQFRWAQSYSERYTALRGVRDEIRARHGAPLAIDPSYTYRFWRDILGWAPVITEDWEEAARQKDVSGW